MLNKVHSLEFQQKGCSKQNLEREDSQEWLGNAKSRHACLDYVIPSEATNKRLICINRVIPGGVKKTC